MATLVRIAAHLRAILASHVALKLVDRRRFRSAHDVERDGLIGIATKTSDLAKAICSAHRLMALDFWCFPVAGIAAASASPPRWQSWTASCVFRASAAPSATSAASSAP